MRFLRTFLKAVFFLGFAFFLASVAIFALLEAFPSLSGRLYLGDLPYYLLKERYINDPELVFRYKPFFSVNSVWIGDDYSAEYNIPQPRIPYVARYNESGFRTSQKDAEPAEVVVLGDSYVEIGAKDAETFPSLFQEASGLKTANLGIAWYGPDQYLIVLKRFGISKKPKIALLCFFEGNDLRDVAEFANWKDGKPYYWFERSQSLPVNYFRAAKQAGKAAAKYMLSKLSNHSQTEGFHPNLAEVKLGDQVHPFAFGYRNDTRKTAEIETSPEWNRFLQILKDFRNVCDDNNIIPIVIYLPTKTHLYARFTTTNSGRNWLSIRDAQIQAAGNEERAVKHACEKADIKMITLTPLFDSMADNGRLLYYPFDSHWNTEGRKAAAEYVAKELSQ